MATLPVSDPPRRTAEVLGAPLSYTDEGEGPPLVLVHGLPGSARDYRYLAPQLDGVRVVRVDLPGYGRSPRRGRRAWSPEARAEVVAGLIEVLDLAPCVVAGHSMGGPVTAALAASRPELVAGVGLLASPGLRAHQGFLRSGVHVIAPILRLPGVTRLFRLPIRKAFVALGFPSSTPYEEQLTTIFDAATLDFNRIGRDLASLSQPTLLAWAEDDALVEAAIGEEIATVVPDGPRLIWPRGGHNVQKTHAEALGAALAAFTREQATQG